MGMMKPIGFYVTCDDAECADCHESSEWRGFEDWTEPIVIWSDTESDTPTHCHICGNLIPHALTHYGYRYVQDEIASDIKSGYKSPATEQWMDEYGSELDWQEYHSELPYKYGR